MLIVAKECHVLNSSYIVYQAGVFSSSGAVHAVMKICAKVWHFLEKVGKMSSIPHETSGWVLHRIKHTEIMAEAT
jgi:hypothetical protein